MPRLFISHSSKDSVQALAFQRWLEANGWSKDDVFIDLHGIGAGERWRDTLRKANATCEAVILLASPAVGRVKAIGRDPTFSGKPGMLGRPVARSARPGLTQPTWNVL